MRDRASFKRQARYPKIKRPLFVPFSALRRCRFGYHVLKPRYYSFIFLNINNLFIYNDSTYGDRAFIMN